ncbi:MAG: large conductance mechanosensitive channel protein MscL [Chloroflexi bacterium]|nr:MAG: large conductance mechanosensitive channel protein MscL [Chloroflexota bacterium]
MPGEFKQSIMRSNAVDLAVTIVIGIAFGTIVTSLVSGIIMLPVGLLWKDVGFADHFIVLQEGEPAGPYAPLDEAKAAGAVTINYGVFITTVIIFIIIAFAIFLLAQCLDRVRRQTGSRRW